MEAKRLLTRIIVVSSSMRMVPAPVFSNIVIYLSLNAGVLLLLISDDFPPLCIEIG
jgi:hypothetical protein